MASFPKSLAALCACAFCSCLAGISQPAQVHSPREVLVIYNAASSVSSAIARDYAKLRKVNHLLAVRCQDSAIRAEDETIPLALYQSQIAAPTVAYLARHTEINFIVLTKGVPIRIDGGETGSRDENTDGNLHPSVDSYLAAMGYASLPEAVKIHIHGSGAKGYGWLNRYWKANVPFSHAAFGGYLVTRLDGYTQADAESLVRRALAVEDPHPQSAQQPGAVLLDVQPIFKFTADEVAPQPLPVTGDIADESDYGNWNADMVKAGEMLQALHIPTELDRQEAFVGHRDGLLGYFSWGSNDPKFTAEAYRSLHFAPGALSETAVSTSARTFLPTHGGQSLIADLIAHGVTGVKGYSDEPLLQAVASPSVLLDRYISGYTLAESFYAASRFVGWEDIVIGDPLAQAPKKMLRSK